MSVQLRDEVPPEDATVLIHMGAGQSTTLLQAAIRNYAEYAGLGENGTGLFTVSVFAVTAEVTEQEIVMTMRHRTFARVRVGDLTAAGFRLLPTTENEADDEMRTLQSVHFDIVLDVVGDAVDDPQLLAPSNETIAQLELEIARLTAVRGMAQRIDKYDLYGDN